MRHGRRPAAAHGAYTSEANRLRAPRADFRAHLSKPVEPAALVDTLVKLAARRPPREG